VIVKYLQWGEKFIKVLQNGYLKNFLTQSRSKPNVHITRMIAIITTKISQIDLKIGDWFLTKYKKTIAPSIQAPWVSSEVQVSMDVKSSVIL